MVGLPLPVPCNMSWSNFGGNPGHTFIDLLKIDIEGAEFDTLTTFLGVHKLSSLFLSMMLPIGLLQLKLHAWDDYGKFDLFHDWLTLLKVAGLRPFWTKANLVYMNYNPGEKPKLAEVGFMEPCCALGKVTDHPNSPVLVYQYS